MDPFSLSDVKWSYYLTFNAVYQPCPRKSVIAAVWCEGLPIPSTNLWHRKNKNMCINNLLTRANDVALWQSSGLTCTKFNLQMQRKEKKKRGVGSDTEECH